MFFLFFFQGSDSETVLRGLENRGILDVYKTLQGIMTIP